MANILSVAVHALLMQMLTSLIIDEILLLRYVNSYKCTHQCLLTSRNLYSLALFISWILSPRTCQEWFLQGTDSERVLRESLLSVYLDDNDEESRYIIIHDWMDNILPSLIVWRIFGKMAAYIPYFLKYFLNTLSSPNPREKNRKKLLNSNILKWIQSISERLFPYPTIIICT